MDCGHLFLVGGETLARGILLSLPAQARARQGGAVVVTIPRAAVLAVSVVGAARRGATEAAAAAAGAVAGAGSVVVGHCGLSQDHGIMEALRS